MDLKQMGREKHTTLTLIQKKQEKVFKYQTEKTSKKGKG